MADMMKPPGKYGAAATDPVRKNVSIMNPMDLASMKQSGDFANIESMTVSDVLSQLGIDPNGPATQLVEFGKKQVQNADMVGKMQNIAADTEGMEEEAPTEDTGLEGLLSRR